MATNEILIQDNTLNSHSSQHMLHQVMQKDGSYWDALRLLDMVKERNPNTVYLVKFSEEKKPEAIMWMLPEMREDIVCFGRKKPTPVHKQKIICVYLPAGYLPHLSAPTNSTRPM
eukprot:15336222-Ditylum_brightwellii.AAC.1